MHWVVLMLLQQCDDVEPIFCFFAAKGNKNVNRGKIEVIISF
jgi:hypothetical protein